MTTKPRLTPTQARYFCEVDAEIRRGGYSSENLEQAFSDCHDGGLFACEVAPLVRKRLLRWVKLTRYKDFEGDGLIGLGTGKTVDITDRAIRIFWPKLWKLRNRRRSAQSAGGRARAAKLSPDRRSDIARRAAQARWSRTTP